MITKSFSLVFNLKKCCKVKIQEYNYSSCGDNEIEPRFMIQVFQVMAKRKTTKRKNLDYYDSLWSELVKMRA